MRRVRAGMCIMMTALRQLILSILLIRVVPPGDPVPCYEGLQMSRRSLFMEERIQKHKNAVKEKKDGKGKETGTVDHFERRGFCPVVHGRCS